MKFTDLDRLKHMKQISKAYSKFMKPYEWYLQNEKIDGKVPKHK